MLKIVVGFLSDRELVVGYKGAKSYSKKMPGSDPEGTVLGMFLFLILINDIVLQMKMQVLEIKLQKEQTQENI